MEKGGRMAKSISVADNTTGEGSKWQRERGRSEEERAGGVPFSRSDASLSLPLGRAFRGCPLRERLKLNELSKRGCLTYQKGGGCGHPISGPCLSYRLVSAAGPAPPAGGEVPWGCRALSLSVFVCAHSHSPGTNAFLALSLSKASASTARY